MNEDFKARVLGWLKTEDQLAVEVLAVEGIGSDFSGSTEGGFYETFSAYVTYRREDGTRRSTEAGGHDMADLWKAVMA